MGAKLQIINRTRTKLPRISFAKIKEAALGKNYSLNIIFTTAAEIKKLNKIYRGKATPTDILSFPLSKNEGEIYISPTEARKVANNFDRSYANFIAFLFVHGCTHLKGYDHGGTMESIEARIRKQFGI